MAVLNGSRLPGTLITPDRSDPSEIYGTVVASGPGGASGLTGTNAQMVTNEVYAYTFGTRLVSGDVNGDGVADLVQLAATGVGIRVIGYPGGSERGPRHHRRLRQGPAG